MKSVRSLLLAGFVAAALFLAAVGRTLADGTVPGYVICRIRPGASISRLAQAYRTTVLDHVPGSLIYTLKVPAGGTVAGFADRLRGDWRVVYAEGDTFFSNPELKGKQLHFAFDAGPDPAGYENQGAYQQVSWGDSARRATGDGVVVAVLDTGIDAGHPVFAGRLLPGYNAVDPGSEPLDVADGAGSAAVGHGTMVAGIVARIAPEARIMPVKILNGAGKGRGINAAKGIYFAVAQGARILNMSFGSFRRSAALNEALDHAERAGAVLVGSAGNEGLERVHFPATGKGALAVGAVEADYTKAAYSNYGSWIRVVAPGTGIRSTYPGGGYATWTGTSFAAPFVSAAAALLFSTGPGMTEDLVKSTLRGTARSVDPMNPGYEGKLGNGIIDMDAAVAAALG